MGRRADHRWLDQLSDEDLAFLKRFLLASGTLKDLAGRYGVSYPTIRLRLDRLIQKVELLDEHRDASPAESKLRAFYAEGRLDDEVFGELLRALQKEVARDGASSG